MAFPTGSVLDDFNRADEGPPPSSSWSNDPLGYSNDLKVVSNVCAASGNRDSDAYWNVATFGADCEAFFTIATEPTTNKTVDVFARLVQLGSGTADGYAASWKPVAGTNNDLIQLWRIDNGSFTQIGTDETVELTTGDKLGIECSGSTITAYYDTGGGWTACTNATATDATHGAAGNIGIIIRDSTTRVDDFGGGTISAGGYTLSVDAGAFAITGTDANTEYHRVLGAGTDAFAVTGTAANLEYHRVLGSGGGSYSVSGTDANLEYHRVFAAAGGAFALSGTDANPERHYVLGVDGGTYVVSGTDATLTYTAAGEVLTAESGAFIITGTAANLEYHYVLGVEGGAFEVTGMDAALTVASGGAPVSSGKRPRPIRFPSVEPERVDEEEYIVVDLLL